VTVTGNASSVQPHVGEVKPISRAEDVARRAQEFLRKVAVGKSMTAQDSTVMTGPGLSGLAPLAQAPGMTSTIAQSLPGSAVASINQTLKTDQTNVQAVALQAPRQVLTLVPESKPLIHPSAQTMLGVRETPRGVLFVQPLTSGRTIAIAASFNGWSSTLHTMVRDESLGIFQLCIKLPTGKFSYKLVVDGKWIADPYNTATEPNPFGEINSVGYAAGVQ
jgi:hypothetical protein